MMLMDFVIVSAFFSCNEGDRNLDLLPLLTMSIVANAYTHYISQSESFSSPLHMACREGHKKSIAVGHVTSIFSFL